MIPWIDDATVRAWRDVWTELGQGYKALALPLRLLNAGVEYCATEDKRALLALAMEERKLLEPVLGIVSAR